MTVLSTCKFLAAAAAVILPASSIFAAATASDNAGNYTGGTYIGLNNGTGFNPFSFLNSGNSGSFVGSSAFNNGGASGNINTSGNSFGLYSNNGGFYRADRSFTTGGSNNSNVLGLGQTFSLSLDNGYVNNGGAVGFNLVSTAGTTRLNFGFNGGNSNYTYNSAVTAALNGNTGVGYTGDGLTVTFTQGAANTYSLAITPNGGATTTVTGTLTASDITGFQVYNSNAGSGGNYDFFFNSPTVGDTVAPVPEPFTSAGTGLLIGFAAFKLARRRMARKA